MGEQTEILEIKHIRNKYEKKYLGQHYHNASSIVFRDSVSKIECNYLPQEINATQTLYNRFASLCQPPDYCKDSGTLSKHQRKGLEIKWKES